MEAGQLWRQYVIAGIANIAMASIAYSMGWTSPIYIKLQDENLTDSPLPAPLTIDESAWVGSFLPIGAIMGSFIGGLAASKIGRKWSLLCAAMSQFVGWILVAAATKVGFLYGGRVFWGITLGMLFTVLPMYCAEIATDDVRGALGSLLQAFMNVGYLLVYGIGPFTSYSVVAYVGMAFVAVFAICFFFMPETPVYHLSKNERELAAECLKRIRGRSRAGVESEVNQMADHISSSMEKTATLADVFRGSNFKAFYITCALLFFQQFSGINAVIFYMSSIFRAAGSDLDWSISTIIVGVIQLVASMLTPLVVDRLGRRIPLLVSTFGTATSLGLLGMYYLVSDQKSPVVSSIGFLPILSMVLFIVTYSWGLGPLPWALLGELFPIEVKAVATPIISGFCGILTFLVTRYFEPIANALGMYVVFWLLGVCCAAGFFFTLFLVPETKGKSLQEIQDMLAGRKSRAGKA
ncbi:unnamed protein product [Parnassius apollo]|uniref:(apollo) hypothetical protein n=1 Tax=Parnassius apollo TaxID=110799 RepID=A0A8S3XFC6_PARAO|nr:unnamed protein product [Parnassius apollo]